MTRPTKRRKTAAERMDAAEIDRRLDRWDAALLLIGDAAGALSIEATGKSIAARDRLSFTPMAADFAWAKRIEKRVRQITDEIARYT